MSHRIVYSSSIMYVSLVVLISICFPEAQLLFCGELVRQPQSLRWKTHSERHSNQLVWIQLMILTVWITLSLPHSGAWQRQAIPDTLWTLAAAAGEICSVRVNRFTTLGDYLFLNEREKRERFGIEQLLLFIMALENNADITLTLLLSAGPTTYSGEHSILRQH